MHINKIDDLLDKVINDFFFKIISKDSILPKVYKEANFVKFQKEINSIMSTFINSVNLSEIRELVKSNDAVYSISETIKRYIAFYLFLTIGFNYSGKDDTYINNIIEFTKNQPEFGYKIDNFFNSSSNSLLIKYNNMIKNILTLLDADQLKLDTLKTKPEYKEVLVFLNQLGFDYVTKNFKLENKQTQGHNIIKTIIILLLYKVTEKKEFFRLLEMTENLDGEYMFIDIVVPKQKYVDFSTVEKLFGATDASKNTAHYLWQFFSEHEEAMQKPPISIEEKIIFLLQSGIMYPICDDFLLFHKDSEKYDKITDPVKIKRKEDTKIRYIINKIETTSEYYSEQTKRDEKIKANIKKNFYIPLLHKKAIIVNHNEDINIINKFINQGKRSIENNEYFNDLLNYKSYPYINFKEFEKTGFSVTLPKTIDVIRYVSIANTGEFKQNKNNVLQMRVGGKDTTINVVGFVIPTNLKQIQCIKSTDIIDIKNLSKKNQNGYDLTMKYLKETVLGTKTHNSSVFWLFDHEKDIATTSNIEYERPEKLVVADQIKHIVSLLYENIIQEFYYIALSKFEKHENLNIQIATKLLNMLQKKIIKFPPDSQLETKLEEKIYQLIEKIEPKYDTNEDIIYGISNDVIKLPTSEDDKNGKIKTLTINLEKNIENEIEEPKETTEGICQHNISWAKIYSAQRTNPSQYADRLYNFIQQYVWENVDQEFVCKSCGVQLNMKKYIIDGVFDDDTQKFVTYSMPMDIPLEDIPEYEKYKISVRNIDKIIEKIAFISNIPHLTKASFNVKWRRKAIIKDAIDMLLMNNRLLKSNYKERNEMASKTYGVSRDISDFFIFELENSIFVFSSKDKDFRKPIKQNNIISYLLFLIILEINESQILFVGGEKKGICNLQIFEKVFHPLFDGLKIRINNKGDIANITTYKILCYLIYIIGCSIIKYNMWYYEYPDITKKKAYTAVIQKILVHTLVDVINSILENSSTPNAHYLYEIVSIKFFKKLMSTFSDEELYKRLQNNGKTSLIGEKKEFILTKKKSVTLSGKFTPLPFNVPPRLIIRMPKFFMKKNVMQYLKYYNINNVTNCKSGEFHDWNAKDGEYVCKLCDIELKNVKLNKSDSEKILKEFKYVRLQGLSTKFCYVDGLLHQFIQKESENNDTLCIKCKNSESHKYSHEELDKLEISLEKTKEQKSAEVINKEQSIESEIKKDENYIEKIYNALLKEYTNASSSGKNYKFIDDLLDIIQGTIGNETKQGSETFLRENAYIINHDHLGYTLDKNVILTDTNNKINYKQNHSFFKKDVIHYTSHNKLGKIEIFYDATTKILLGYREESKNFVENKKHDRRIIINYSILNKLKILGYPSQFIDVSSEYNDYFSGKENIENIDKDLATKEIVMNIIRKRISNLKKTIYEFQRTLSKILNNYYSDPILFDDETEYFSNKFIALIENHKKKISEVSLTNEKREHLIFKHWKAVDKGIFAKNLQEVKYKFDEQSTINTDDLNKLDQNGNIILYFIVTELTKLLDYNPNKFAKASVCYFIIDFINLMFESFNIENLTNNIDIKRFGYILSSATYIQEIMEKTGVRETEGIYSEYREEMSQEEKEKLMEEKQDSREEQEAMDLESEYDYEGGFDRAQDWEPSREIVFNPSE